MEGVGPIGRRRGLGLGAGPLSLSLPAPRILGLCNNFAYVVMLSAAHDVLRRHQGPPNGTQPVGAGSGGWGRVLYAGTPGNCGNRLRPSPAGPSGAAVPQRVIALRLQRHVDRGEWQAAGAEPAGRGASGAEPDMIMLLRPCCWLTSCPRWSSRSRPPSTSTCCPTGEPGPGASWGGTVL